MKRSSKRCLVFWLHLNVLNFWIAGVGFGAEALTIYQEVGKAFTESEPGVTLWFGVTVNDSQKAVAEAILRTHNYEFYEAETYDESMLCVEVPSLDALQEFAKMAKTNLNLFSNLRFSKVALDRAIPLKEKQERALHDLKRSLAEHTRKRLKSDGAGNEGEREADDLAEEDLAQHQALAEFLAHEVFPDPLFQNGWFSYFRRWRKAAKVDASLAQYLDEAQAYIRSDEGDSMPYRFAEAKFKPKEGRVLLSARFPKRKDTSLTPEVRSYLDDEWGHMAEDFDDILDYTEAKASEADFYANPADFLAAWREKRGFTEMLRVPEDIALKFFGHLAEKGRLESFLAKAKAMKAI